MQARIVAPSRVRELKLVFEQDGFKQDVAPSRVRELKLVFEQDGFKQDVAPSRVRELKHIMILLYFYSWMSHPHGCVN